MEVQALKDYTDEMLSDKDLNPSQKVAALNNWIDRLEIKIFTHSLSSEELREVIDLMKYMKSERKKLNS